MHIYKKQILEQYLDFYGHVNNASYLTLFEEARWDLVSQRGFGYDFVQKTRKGPIILEVSIKFSKELRLREWVIIETKLLNYAGKIGEIEQRIIKDSGVVATSALFKFGLFDLEARRLIELDEDWKKAFS
jgi:acyl-CoA thioester hydrolase